MIIQLSIILIIIVILFNSMIYNSIHACPKLAVKISYARGSRLPGNDSDDKFGIDTINLKLDRDIPCGIYNLNTTYGKGTLYVSKNDKRFGYLTIDNMNLLNKVSVLDLWNIERIESDNNYFIMTYNRGCC